MVVALGEAMVVVLDEAMVVDEGAVTAQEEWIVVDGYFYFINTKENCSFSKIFTFFLRITNF